MDFRQRILCGDCKARQFHQGGGGPLPYQPTLTGHIQSIENELGTVLLNRYGKSITLTEAGRILYSHAVNILNMREAALFPWLGMRANWRSSPLRPARYLRGICFPVFWPPLAEYPGITYAIKQFDSRGVAGAIISGSMDFGLWVVPPLPRA